MLLAFLANLKKEFEGLGVCEVHTIQVLAYGLSDRSEKVYKPYTANGTNTSAHAHHETCLVVINNLTERVLPKTVPRKAHSLVL